MQIPASLREWKEDLEERVEDLEDEVEGLLETIEELEDEKEENKTIEAEFRRVGENGEWVSNIETQEKLDSYIKLKTGHDEYNYYVDEVYLVRVPK